jgi:hypothetical protein
VRTRYRNAATLGNLLHEVNNNLQLTGIDADFPRVANQVNDTGKKAVHQGLLSEDEARLPAERASALATAPAEVNADLSNCNRGLLAFPLAVG